MSSAGQSPFKLIACLHFTSLSLSQNWSADQLLKYMYIYSNIYERVMAYWILAIHFACSHYERWLLNTFKIFITAFLCDFPWITLWTVVRTDCLLFAFSRYEIHFIFASLVKINKWKAAAASGKPCRSDKVVSECCLYTSMFRIPWLKWVYGVKWAIDISIWSFISVL